MPKDQDVMGQRRKLGKGMMTWRPIETAPKDGRCILVYSEIWPEIAVAKWSGFDCDWRLHPDSEDGAISTSLSHWMPLPKPPVCNTSATEYATPLQHPDKDAR